MPTGGIKKFKNISRYKGLMLYGSSSNGAGSIDETPQKAVAAAMPGWNGARSYCGIADLRRYGTEQRLVAEV